MVNHIHTNLILKKKLPASTGKKKKNRSFQLQPEKRRKIEASSFNRKKEEK
jgi:hypothetical protein